MDNIPHNKMPHKGTGKRSKHFLEPKEALELATSIADLQEGKSISKAEKRHRYQTELRRDRNPSKVSFKERIEAKKALIIAQRAQAKKAKAKNKVDVDGVSDRRCTSGSSESHEPARKRVMFA